MLNVIFDVSVISDPASRSGLSRYGIQLALGLHESQLCNVSYCAGGSIWAEWHARRFMEQHPALDASAMPRPGWAMRLPDLKASLEKRVGPLGHASTRLVDHLMRAAGQLRRPIAAGFRLSR